MNYVQNEETDFAGKSGGQQPIMLARLPRVGTALSTPSRPAAHQAVAPPESIPQLELRSEIEQRTRLPTAATAADDHASSATHFVDRQHIPQPQLSAPPEPSGLHQSHSTTTKSTATKPTATRSANLGEMLYQLHSELAPHAGLIVALALIASAGLLYWMIVGPAHAPLPNVPTPGFEMQPEGFGAMSAAVPEFAADWQPATPATNSPEQRTPLPVLAMPQHVAVPDPLTLPPAAGGATLLTKTPPTGTPPVAIPAVETRAPARRESPSTGLLQFPTTRHPQNLDFTAIHGNAPTVAGPPLPEVAQRRTATSNR